MNKKRVGYGIRLLEVRRNNVKKKNHLKRE